MTSSNSEFYLWKTAIALLYLDGRGHGVEKQWLQSRIQKSNLSKAQREELLRYILNPSNDYFAPFEKVTNASDREELLKLAKIIFNLDNNLSHREAHAYENLIERHKAISASREDQYRRIAHEMVKDMNRQKIYRDLDRLGKFLNTQIYGLRVLYRGLWWLGL